LASAQVLLTSAKKESLWPQAWESPIEFTLIGGPSGKEKLDVKYQGASPRDVKSEVQVLGTPQQEFEGMGQSLSLDFVLTLFKTCGFYPESL
jgi:hypothetical protein